MYRYIIIESKRSIEDHESLIITIFSEFFDIKDMIKKENKIILFFEQETDVSFLEVILNMTSDLYDDFRIYVSYSYHQIELRNAHLSFVEDQLKNISFNKFNYIDDKTILEYRLKEINHQLKQFILRKYDADQIMIESIKTYLESNQNTVIASKKLYIHRNTLIQRLDKFYQETGFDVRNFKDAYLIYLLIK